MCNAMHCALCWIALLPPGVSVSVEAKELTVELSEASGHWGHFLPLTPPTVEHLFKLQSTAGENQH